MSFIADESNEVLLHRKLAFTAGSGDGLCYKFSDKTCCLFGALYMKLSEVLVPVTPL